MLAAEPQHLHGDHLDAEQVIGGQPVFEAMHSAGILSNVTADRTGDLA